MFQTRDELTKNRREDSEAEEGGLMFERRGDPKCPVQSMDVYVSKLNPKCDAFFQRPRKQIAEGDLVWYDNQVVNMLGSKMKSLSRQAQSSKDYTNHSIHATSVTILDHGGFEARHIMCVSGHKSESSIRSYASKTSDEIKLATCMFSGLVMLCAVDQYLPVQTYPRQSLQEVENSTVTENRTIAIDSSTSSKSQFSSYNCTVNIINR